MRNAQNLTETASKGAFSDSRTSQEYPLKIPFLGIYTRKDRILGIQLRGLRGLRYGARAKKPPAGNREGVRRGSR